MTGARVTEKQFQRSVIDMARIAGWLAYHTYDSRRSEPGFPDLVLVKPPRLIFAELKSEKGRLTPAQRRWLARLRECRGIEVYLWRPRDWNSIVETLARAPVIPPYRGVGTGSDSEPVPTDRPEGLTTLPGIRYGSGKLRGTSR